MRYTVCQDIRYALFPCGRVEQQLRGVLGGFEEKTVL
jgi:hypothetical protein